MKRAILPLIIVCAATLAFSCIPNKQKMSSVERSKVFNKEFSDGILKKGWGFAIAITNDANDRAMCQERVAIAYMKNGNVEKALELAEEIQNWRKGVVIAEASAIYAEAGNTNKAVELASKAETIAREIQDWQRDRILVRTGKTGALLGMSRQVAGWSAFYASNRDYRGEIAAYHALALAREGALDKALAVLEGLTDEAKHFDVIGGRVNGYLLLAKKGFLNDSKDITNILAMAWASTEKIAAGAMKLDMQMSLVETAVECGQKELARKYLEQTTALLMTNPNSGHAPWLVKLAIRWGQLKDAMKVEEIARAAEPLIFQNMVIDQPALLAQLGEAMSAAGMRKEAFEKYNKAIESAGKLANPRPRAIACVDICLSLERSGLNDRRIEKELDHLLSGFNILNG